MNVGADGVILWLVDVVASVVDVPSLTAAVFILFLVFFCDFERRKDG
jgi:hypothetical protein